MKIAIDFDETIFYSKQKFIDFHNAKFKTKINYKKKEDEKIYDYLKIDYTEYINRFIIFSKTKYHEKIKPIEDSIEIIKKIKKENELYIITARNNLIKKETLFLLNKYFKNCFKKIIFLNYTNKKKDEKFEICKKIKIDLIIEDNLDNAYKCAENGIFVILLKNKNHNFQTKKKIKHKKIIIVKNWKEIEKQIKNIKIKMI
ncbi:MAG: hypothetical protein PHR26_00495 [Candidatus ainarchaeum sp.]|nr:hypothetical protein [Candidatus ainarchaeum sp.]MDD3975799.1 hypothetical protein [Candidatus ainarchaeum sp.]